MEPTNLSYVKILTWVAAVSAGLIAITLPLAFLVFSYQTQVAALDDEAEINARLLSQVIDDRCSRDVALRRSQA